MTSVIDVMSDAIGALDYATDVLEAPAGSQMRQTVAELKEARKTVADMLAAMEGAYGHFLQHMERDWFDDDDQDAMQKMFDAIAKAKGEE
jgi:hypothetical protein